MIDGSAIVQTANHKHKNMLTNYALIQNAKKVLTKLGESSILIKLTQNGNEKGREKDERKIINFLKTLFTNKNVYDIIDKRSAGSGSKGKEP